MISQVVVQMEGGKEPLEEDVLFLISLLDVQDKEEFVELFSDTLDEVVSKSGKWKLLRGRIHISDDKMLMIIQADDRARSWLINKVKEKMEKAAEIMSKMESEVM
uniref:hypothetical protein n=1 Tax=Sulfolobus tengchongensis TaxID=207809 RepID=UPI00159ED087|nr:hypothetical protein [Sulfolobus tengchongensis]